MTWRPTDFGSSPVRARPLSGREEARVVRHPSSALVRRSLFHVKHPIRRARRAHRISESAGSGDGALRQTNDGAETPFGARPPNPLLREFRADRPLRSRPIDKGIARDERSPHRLEKLQSPKPAHALSGPPIPAARGPLPAPCSLLPPLGTRPSGLESAIWAGSRSASGSAESALGLSGLAPLHPAVGPLLLVFDSRLPVNGPCSKSLVLVDRFRLQTCDSRLEPPCRYAPQGRTPADRPDTRLVQIAGVAPIRRSTQVSAPPTDVMPSMGGRDRLSLVARPNAAS